MHHQITYISNINNTQKPIYLVNTLIGVYYIHKICSFHIRPFFLFMPSHDKMIHKTSTIEWISIISNKCTH